MARAAAPRYGNSLPWRSVAIGIFAALCAHGIEPIGQASGWWYWVDYSGFYTATERWFGVVGLLSTLGLAVASFGLARRSLVVGSVLGFLVAVNAIMSRIAPEVGMMPALLLLIPAVAAFVRGRPRLGDAMLSPEGEAGLSALERAIPAVATWAILGTLLYYVLSGPAPELWVNCVPLALVRGASDLWLSRWERRAQPAATSTGTSTGASPSASNQN